ncbi:MAG: MFS transporter, partial [Thermomicrobiales bacterium]|nr:MFS transporter [Thermomicrobiales bacterium]
HRARMPLERVNAAGQTMQSLALLLGPPLAGGLIALLGPSNVLWLDAASFGISALLIAGLVPRVAIQRAEQGEGYLAEVTAGLRFILKEDRLLRGILPPSMAINFLAAPLFPVVLPVFAARAYGEAIDLGVLVAGFGAGMLTGSLAYGAVGSRWSKRATLIAGTFLNSLPFFALALSPPLPVAVALMVASGLAIAPVNPLVMTAIQQRTPAALQGRVIGAVIASATLLAPLGMLTAGVVLTWTSAGVTLFIIGAGFLAMSAAIARDPVFAELDGDDVANYPYRE